MATVRLTCSLTSGSWVTTTMVTPSSRLSRRKQVEDLVRRGRVELAGRLVGEEDLGPVGQRDRDGDALLLAAGQASGRWSARSARPTRSSSSARAAPRRGRHAVEDHRQLDVLERRQVRQQVARRLLPDEADDLAPVARLLASSPSRQVVPATTARPADGTSSPPRMFSERALAGPGRADERDELARLDEQVETLERDDLEVGDLVDLDQVVAHDERRSPKRGGRGSRARARRREVDDLG